MMQMKQIQLIIILIIMGKIIKKNFYYSKETLLQFGW